MTDAQVQPPTESSSWLDALRQFVFELNLRRNWKVATSFVPDYVVSPELALDRESISQHNPQIFLGDQLAQGKYIQSRSEYVASPLHLLTMFNSVSDSRPT